MEAPLLKLDGVPLALSMVKLEGSSTATRALFSSASSKSTSRATSISLSQTIIRGTSISGNLTPTRLFVKKKKLNKLLHIPASPWVARPEITSTDMYDLENRHWQEAFDAMEGSYITDVVKDVDKNKDNRPADEKRPALPYHCDLPHCHIQTSDIPLKLQNLIDRREKPADTTPYLCVVGNTSHMPKVNKTVQDKKVFSLTRWKQLELDQKQKPPAASTPQLQLPITCLTVTWAVTSSHTQDKLCNWLRQFGKVVFRIPLGGARCRMYVVFNKMMEAHRAVNCALRSVPLGVTVEWSNPKFNNYGDVKPLQWYTVIGDAKWKAMVYFSREEAKLRREAVCSCYKYPKVEKIKWRCPKPQ